MWECNRGLGTRYVTDRDAGATVCALSRYTGRNRDSDHRTSIADTDSDDYSFTTTDRHSDPNRDTFAFSHEHTGAHDDADAHSHSHRDYHAYADTYTHCHTDGDTHDHAHPDPDTPRCRLL